MLATKRTKPPSHYIEPTDKEVVSKAKLLGLDNFSINLVRDVANIAAGGSYVDYDEIYSSLAKVTRLERDKDGDYIDSDTGAYAYSSTGNYTRDYQTAFNSAVLKKAEYNQDVQNFIKELEFHRAPGKTPLTKAVNIVNMVSKASESKQSKNSNGNNDKDCSEQKQKIPIFDKYSDDSKNSSQIGKDFNNAFEEVTRLDPEEKHLVTSEDSEEVLEKIEENEELDKSEKRELGRMTIASEMTKGKDIWLKVSRRLESLINFRTRSFKKTIPSVEGNSVRTRPIENIGEINKMISSEWTNPKTLRLLRVMTRQAQVRERVYTVDQKQLLYLLIDSSGSMYGDRIYKAGGVLMNRLKAVVKEQAEVFVRFFDDEVYEEHHATSPEEASKLMRYFEKHNFGGSGTDITRAVRKAKESIDKKMAANELLVEPEIVIVTDGEDHGVRSLNAKDFLPTVVNGIIIDLENRHLADFCRKTRGVVIQNL